MIKDCSPAEKESLGRGQCPDCAGQNFIKGPSGGLAINIQCAGCYSWFNVTPGFPDFAQRIHLSEELTQIEMDLQIARGCGNPNCEHDHGDLLFLHSVCHTGAGVEVQYHKGGILKITCAECKRPVAAIRVAPNAQKT